jgi:anti-sigma factor RsiW
MMATAMSSRCEDVAELLPAYALGALDRDEAILTGDHLAMCPACRAELMMYEAVVGEIGGVAPSSPPSALRERVLASVAADRGEGAVHASRPVGLIESRSTASKERRRPRLLTYGLAAAAVVLIGVMGVLAMLLADARDSRDEATAGEQQLASYLSAGGQVMPMSALAAADYGSSFGQGSLVTAPGKPPLVVVGGCPASSDGREYRVWLERDGDRTRVGVLDVGDEGTGWLTFDPPEALSTYDAIGVTMVTADDARQEVFVGATEPNVT